MIRLVALAVAAAGQPAPAAPSASPPAPSYPEPSASVSGVTVTAHRPPKVAEVTVTAHQPCPEPQPAHYPAAQDPRVIDSFPRQGASIPPGLTQLRVTFDAPMSCYAEVNTDLISDVAPQPGDRDPCTPEGAWSLPDRRSYFLQCRLQPGVQYAFAFHRDKGRGFIGMSGRDAEGFVLRFATTSADAVTSWGQAQAADPGPPGAMATRGYVACTDVMVAADTDDCRRKSFTKPAPP